MNDYLTETKLGEILKRLYPDQEFIHDKPVPLSSNKRKRPDYRCDNLKIIVEFDGISHYQNVNIILSDIDKDKDYTDLGYNVIRIPYFIQLDIETTYKLFGITLTEDLYNYPHGFIDKKAILPASYCYEGLLKFEQDLKKFSWVSDKVIDSLKTKISTLGIRKVLPEPLNHLLK